MSSTTKANKKLYQKEYDSNKKSADDLYYSESGDPIATPIAEYGKVLSPNYSEAFGDASRLFKQDSERLRHPEMEADLRMQEAMDAEIKNAKYQALRKILGM